MAVVCVRVRDPGMASEGSWDVSLQLGKGAGAWRSTQIEVSPLLDEVCRSRGCRSGIRCRGAEDRRS
jgi:hypothetical protein